MAYILATCTGGVILAAFIKFIHSCLAPQRECRRVARARTANYRPLKIMAPSVFVQPSPDDVLLYGDYVDMYLDLVDYGEELCKEWK
jgi:hypothetical protein